MKLLSPDDLHELLKHESASGKLFWRERPLRFSQSATRNRQFNTKYAGLEALNSKNTGGYLSGTLLGRTALAHRVIFCMEHGWWPKFVDHINGNRADNRLENLRAATKSINGQNQKLFETNTSGHVGVHKLKSNGKFQSNISIDRKRIFLGTFDDFESAVAARLEAQKELGFADRHGT
jgi:hypothetical protein